MTSVAGRMLPSTIYWSKLALIVIHPTAPIGGNCGAMGLHGALAQES
jgi:hypothetical protein